MVSIINSFAEVTDKDFGNKVLENPLPVIVIFERSCWGVTHIMKPILKKVTSSYAGKIEIYRYDMDKYSNVSGSYRVQGGLEILVFNKNTMVNKTGVVSANELKKIIEPIIGSTRV